MSAPSTANATATAASAVARPLDTAAEGLVSAFRSLPCVSSVTQTLTTLNIGAVTEQLEKAAYFPLLMSGATRFGGSRTAAEPRRFVVDTELTNDGLVPRDQTGAPAAAAEFSWRLLAPSQAGSGGGAPPQGAVQSFEVGDFRLRFNGGENGFTAHGMGQTLPGSGRRPGSVGVAFVLDVLEGFGQFRGLVGTVTASGDLLPGQGGAEDSLELLLVVRMADPAGQLLATGALTPVGPAPATPPPGATYMAFLGEVDPSHPVTLRFSLTEGLLGSNVFELLRTARLDFSTVPGSQPAELRARATTGAIAGSVAAQLNFDPLALQPITPITTQNGVFEFHDRLGNSLGTVYADMTEGRSFRTSLEGVLLPVFRFGGFGALRGGTGAFAGARGIMLLNAVISVQPRTLSNLYLFRFAHPAGPVVHAPRRIA